MAYFDKISIDGTPYDVRDTSTYELASQNEVNIENNANDISDIKNNISNINNDIIDLEKRPKGNVKNYGAVGDGVSDDTQAFVKAFTENDVVYVPIGTYLVSGIAIPEYKALIGQDPVSSIIKLKNSSNSNLITNSGLGSVTIKNLYLDGNSANNTSGNCVAFTGHFFTITDVQAWNAPESGFYIYGSGVGSLTDGRLSTLTRCSAKHNNQHGYYIEEGDVQLTNCYCTANSQAGNNSYDGMHLMSACKVVGCHIWGSDNSKGHRYAMYLNNSAIVDSCHIEGAHTNNLYVNGYGNMISNCMLYSLAATTNANDVWFNNGDNVMQCCVINTPNGTNNGIGIGGNSTRISVINCDITAYRAINNAHSAGGNIFIFVGGKGGNSGSTQVVNHQLASDVYIVLGNWDSGRLINSSQWT